MLEHRPANGGGSCARCREKLDLASQKVADQWYCSTACAQGRILVEPRPPAVPEDWLYHRPRRFYRARKPKELRSTRNGE
jgi:DNA-directed RNA polymerase subunit RPC12/RpoP